MNRNGVPEPGDCEVRAGAASFPQVYVLLTKSRTWLKWLSVWLRVCMCTRTHTHTHTHALLRGWLHTKPFPHVFLADKILICIPELSIEHWIDRRWAHWNLGGSQWDVRESPLGGLGQIQMLAEPPLHKGVSWSAGPRGRGIWITFLLQSCKPTRDSTDRLIACNNLHVCTYQLLSFAVRNIIYQESGHYWYLKASNYSLMGSRTAPLLPSLSLKPELLIIISVADFWDKESVHPTESNAVSYSKSDNHVYTLEPRKPKPGDSS